MSRHPQGIDPAQKSKNFKATVHRLITQLKPESLRLGIIIVLVTIAVGTSVAAPKLLGNATNLVFEGIFSQKIPAGTTQQQLVANLQAAGKTDVAKLVSSLHLTPGIGINWHALAIVLLLVLCLYFISSLLDWMAGYLIRTVVQNIGYDLRKRAQNKIDKVSLSYLDTTSRGDLLSRVSNDIDNITQTLLQTLVQLLHSVLSLLGMMVMMFVLSWQLALVTLLIIPLAFFLGGGVMKHAKPHFSAKWKTTGEISSIVEEAFSGHETTLLYGLEESFREEFARTNKESQEATFKAQFFSMSMMPLMSLLSNLAYVLVAVAGGLKVATGQMSLGDVQAFLQYSRQFTQPISNLASMANLIQSGSASAERVFEFLDAPELSEDTRKVDSVIPTEPAFDKDDKGKNLAVSFRNVTFSYEPGKPVIENLNLEVKRGQTVAIVGPTGAGKTTLVNLLMRFYEIESGNIYLGGKNTRDIPRDLLRSQFGMVLQDTWLFSGTIAQNIAFGKKGATEKEITQAAKATSVDRIIRALPDGYDTYIDSEGEGISNGERQLLTIARAFLSNPQILIIDEATSSVDTRTEVLVQKAMNTLRAGRTSFVIAHRLSTIRNADLIVVMENGNVVEQGTHEELMEKRGHYRNLHDAQLTYGENQN
ncbi:ABC transporter ATP-binding protein/permease [Actinomycetaceae bacterium TAE3-ERU4]|nr:ABC transporter ATP-binding protein/permease [Actinomycetaceae bacterium TAE3-ERU4]